MDTPDQAADRLAGRQYGAIAHRQARRCGLSEKQIRDRVDARRWCRCVRGVYTVAGAPETWQQVTMVALLAAPGAVASHLTGAAVLELGRPPVIPHIIVPPTHSCRLPNAKVHRSVLGPGDRFTVNGLVCTSATRTLIDCAALLDERELAKLVDDAFCRQLSCVHAVEAALDRLGRQGRKGSGLLTDVIAAWTPGIQPGSPAEMRLLRLLRQWGYEEPDRQVEVRTADGTLIGRLDLAWIRRRVGLEYDSDRHHSPRRWAPDEARYAAFDAAGWAVVSAGKSDLLPSAKGLRDDLERAFRSAAA